MRFFRFFQLYNINDNDKMLKFRSRDTGACARNIGRTFLHNTLKVIQLNVLYHIFIDYEFEFTRRSL